MINDSPTVCEVVTDASKKQKKEKSSVSNHSSNKSKSNSKEAKHSKASQPKDEEGVGLDEEVEEEHRETLCGAYGDDYGSDEFWICCDVCEKWFHGKCVKITSARTEHIKHYKCPSCLVNQVSLSFMQLQYT